MISDKEYEELKEKEKTTELNRYELRQIHHYENVKYEQYINEIISKNEEDRTEEEQRELDKYGEELLKYEMTHQL